MTNTTKARRPSTAEILAADELYTAARSLQALGSGVYYTVLVQLDRFLQEVVQDDNVVSDIEGMLDEGRAVADAVARIFD